VNVCRAEHELRVNAKIPRCLEGTVSEEEQGSIRTEERA